MDDQPSRQSSPIMHDEPIAKVIGWTDDYRSYLEGEDGLSWTDSDGGRHDDPTVDDLIAWLRERTHYVYVIAPGDPYTVGNLLHADIALYIVTKDGRNLYPIGQSMGAALETAVRQVAGV